MHILFLTDNFPPETNAPATRVFEHARRWVLSGHKVTVVTGAPNFPQGRVYPGYKNRWISREDMDGIRVVRVKTYMTANTGFAKRVLDHISFGVASFFGGLFPRKPDVIVATSPQFFSAVSGWALAAVRRKPFVFELRDLWPASISAVGALKRGVILNTLERLEHFLYRRATAIIPVAYSFKDELTRRGIPAEKVRVVTNGVDTNCYAPESRDSDLARELGVEGQFVVGYLGTHGVAHALENVIEAAERLRDEERITFLFVGEGAARARLIEEVQRRKLTNVVLHPSRPKADMRRLWSLCDVALVHLMNDPLFGSVIPSKIFEAMGMGLPILLAAPAGEASRLVRRAGAGLHVPAEDPEALAAATRRLAHDFALRAELRRSSAFAAILYDRDSLADDMLLTLERVAAGQVACPVRVALPGVLAADTKVRRAA